MRFLRSMLRGTAATGARPPRRRADKSRRSGKILVLVAVLLPVFAAMLGLVYDGGMMLSEYRVMQQVADAAATAAAMELQQGATATAASSVASQYVSQINGLASATTRTNIPPTSGPYAGQSGFVEVTVSQPVATYFLQALGSQAPRTISVSSVAGSQAATTGAAIVVLDPDPPSLSLPGLSSITSLLPAVPSVLGGMQVLGLGDLTVKGSVLVNTTWGGMNQNNQLVGSTSPPPWAVSCTPLVGLTNIYCDNMRVVGGVQNPADILPLSTGGASPLSAGRLPVDDPLISLPVPTVAVDGTNVTNNQYGGVLTLPLIPTVLKPGVYEWIEIAPLSVVTFKPGVYIISSTRPETGLGLSILAGQVTANGVMFYVTNTANYSALSGAPDNADGGTTPPSPGVATLLPSAVINIGLLGSQFSPISDASSPFNGLFFFQRREDRRPIVMAQEALLAGGNLSGTVYAKWGNMVLAGLGTYNARFVVGTMTVATVLDLTIAPTTLLAPAHDVFLTQ